MGLFSFGKSTSGETLRWEQLTSEEALNHWINASHDQPLLLFKHSTRCSISSMALSRLESKWDLKLDELTPVYLDLIQYRSVSNKIADILNVTHQSPQVLLLRNGKCIYHASHNQIDVEAIKENL
ncbi:MAG: bacillithiol system redox-active protein YtxJ [Crocinitomicaceae bacterium]